MKYNSWITGISLIDSFDMKRILNNIKKLCPEKISFLSGELTSVLAGHPFDSRRWISLRTNGIGKYAFLRGGKKGMGMNEKYIIYMAK